MPFFVFTGMSEKLQSIPKETIQGAPKEVVLPPAPDQNGFTNFENIPPNEFTNFETVPPNEFTNFENIPPDLNSTELRGEQLPPDGKSDHDENDEIPNTLNSEIHIPNSLNNKIHIPGPNTISSIESTNLDEPKTAFDTANSIDVELNSTVEPNNFDERGSNSIKNEQNNIDDETLKVSSEQPEFESNSEPELEANISDTDDSDFGDFERSEVPVLSQVNDVNETLKIETVNNVNENCELKILVELPKTDKKQVDDDINNDEMNSIDAYFEDVERKNQVYQKAPSRKVEIEDPQIEPEVNYLPIENHVK